VAREPGKESVAADPPGDAGAEAADEESGGTLNTIPELMRRIVTAGLSGFFLTEEAIRKAVGETLPKDWSEFAVEQSERTRADLMERLSHEIGRTLENIDVVEVLSQLLAGSTIEVKAEIRMKRDAEGGAPTLKIAAKEA
jgi:hypothetical protein